MGGLPPFQYPWLRGGLSFRLWSLLYHLRLRHAHDEGQEWALQGSGQGDQYR